jgi:hypothetical protein
MSMPVRVKRLAMPMGTQKSVGDPTFAPLKPGGMMPITV